MESWVENNREKPETTQYYNYRFMYPTQIEIYLIVMGLPIIN